MGLSLLGSAVREEHLRRSQVPKNAFGRIIILCPLESEAIKTAARPCSAIYYTDS